MFRHLVKVVSQKSSVQNLLRQAIESSLKPTRLQIYNQSHRHSRGTDTHFNLLIVSEQFKNLSKVQQHKLVYSSVGDLMKQLHALTLTCYQEEPEKGKAWSLGCFNSKEK